MARKNTPVATPDTGGSSSGITPSTGEQHDWYQASGVYLKEYGNALEDLGSHDSAQVEEGLAKLRRLYADRGDSTFETNDALNRSVISACLIAAQRFDITPEVRKKLLEFARTEAKYLVDDAKRKEIQLLLEFLENAYAKATVEVTAGAALSHHLLIKDGQPVVIAGIRENPGWMVDEVAYDDWFRVYEVVDAGGSRYLVKLREAITWGGKVRNRIDMTLEEIEEEVSLRRKAHSLLQQAVAGEEFGQEKFKVVIPDTDIRLFRKREKTFIQEICHLDQDWRPWHEVEEPSFDFEAAEDSIMLDDTQGLAVLIEGFNKENSRLQQWLGYACVAAGTSGNYYVLPDKKIVAWVNWWA